MKYHLKQNTILTVFIICGFLLFFYICWNRRNNNQESFMNQIQLLSQDPGTNTGVINLTNGDNVTTKLTVTLTPGDGMNRTFDVTVDGSSSVFKVNVSASPQQKTLSVDADPYLLSLIAPKCPDCPPCSTVSAAPPCKLKKTSKPFIPQTVPQTVPKIEAQSVTQPVTSK